VQTEGQRHIHPLVTIGKNYIWLQGICSPEDVSEVPELACNEHSSTLRYRHSPSYAVVTFQKVRRKSEFSHVGTVVSYTCMYKGSNWSPNSNTLTPDRPQHDRRAAYVIAHQYSSATYSLNGLLFPQGKIRYPFQKYCLFIYLFIF